jgi:hypothetical protein
LTRVIRALQCRRMSNALRAGSHGRSSALRRSSVARRALVTLELVTGAAGLAGGVLLAAAPDGSLLRADLAVLAGTPFSDLPRAFRTADLWLIHAADCCSRYSSWTCCGVRY